MNDCIFCKIIAGDIPSSNVMDSDEIFAFRDINPQAPLHILVLPKRHIARLADMNQAEGGLAGKLLLAANKIARDLGRDEQGYRVVINNGETAGQSVAHLHLHVLSGRPFAWPPG